MVKKLIVAEKPSLMRTILHALETTGERFSASEDKEFYESPSYVATAQFGHLLELKMPEDYPGRASLGGWSLANLPFFPKKYEYNIRSDAKKRYNTIGKLLKRSDIEAVIHCGDPDREGQILVDLVLRNLGNKKPVIRPQLKALTDEAILDAFKAAKANSEYKDVFNEGMTRMCFDWDFGINLSQYATLKTNARPALNVGRVIGAIVTEIYNRDVSIERFVPEEYYKVVSDVEGGFKLTTKLKFPGDKFAEAEAYARKLQTGASVVSDIQKKRITKKPPKLFSQTSLQAAMSKKFNYKPEQTLELAQDLYEKGYISYPRTNTEFIAEAEMGSIRAVIQKINRDGFLEFRDSKAIFDDSKIDGHSAITVTGKRPAGLSDAEKNCYLTILYRFMAVFCKEPCLYDKTTVVIDNPLEQFKVSGEVMFQQGWQRFEPPAKKKKDKDVDDNDQDESRVLPPVNIGDKVETDFKAVSAETKPPAHYSVESLGKWMQNPFRKEDSTDEEDYKNILAGLEIGTEATRAGILSKATEKGYISLKKKAYHIEPRGRFLVESCKGLGIDFSAQMTADMGRKLKAVGRGEIGIMEVLNANREEIKRVIREDRSVKRDSASSGGEGEYVKKEKTEAQVYAPTGKEISFSKTWGSHTFTELEIATLLAGDPITFTMKSSKTKRDVEITGRLAEQAYKGKKFWGFKMDEREFPESFLGHTFTEEERDTLLNGKRGHDKITVDDLWSQKKRQKFSAMLQYKDGQIKMTFPKKSK